MSTQLSEKVKQLIKQSRIVSFQQWQDLYPQSAIEIFQTADDQGRYLSDRDLEQLITLVPELSQSLNQAQLLRDNATDLVAQARAEVLAYYPNITEPGGDLYPPARAEACWRDYWHFLRCITYGIAGRSLQFTSDEGLNYMEQLYQELKVPLGAMILGLEKLKYFSLKQFSQAETSSIAPYFDQMISKLNNFVKV